MTKKHLKFNLAYALVFILVLIAGYTQWHQLSYIVKPCITIVLLLFLTSSTRLKGRFHKRLSIGLFFALAGDILIMMKDHHPSYFLYGLIAFSICYLFYIRAFYLDFRSAQELDKKGARIAIMSCTIGCMAFYLYLRPYLGVFKLPIMFYIFIAALLTMMAVFRNQRVNSLSFKLILTGVLFFVLSNVFLAYTHFIQSFRFADLLIITLYMIAQYLVVLGGVERKLLRN